MRLVRETVPVEDDPRLINRELSLLDYVGRILELACDPAEPLLERVKYCAFSSEHLDEFFAVRVAGLLDQVEAGIDIRFPGGGTPRSVLAEIRPRVLALVRRQATLWSDELCPALAEKGIRIGTVGDCSAAELDELTRRFELELYPVLTPLGVGPGLPFPFISPLSLSLGVFVRDPDSQEERFARVKVPEGFSRFLPVGEGALHVPLEDVIAHFLPALFPQMEIVELGVFRVTRDADFSVSDEADDLRQAVESELRRRRFGDVVRLEVSASMSGAMLDRLQHGLGVLDDQVYLIGAPLDLSEAMELAKLDRPDLKDDAWVPITNTRLATPAAQLDPFTEIRRADLLVHHPYESFVTSFGAFVHAAATDPDVIGVKTTLYRTSEESPIVPALVEAAESGKQCVCLVELQARFDERRNIEWSRALERAGVHVVYGFPNLKVHMKTTLVVRREEGVLRRYVHIGTGNYHAVTARSYEDFGLFTTDADVCADVAELFNYVTGFSRPQRFRKILVAPFNLRNALISEIREVAAAASAGKRARIRIKVNNLTDEAVIEELYEASAAGARVDLVVRGICALRPGVKGLSDNVRVRSVLGRFLEHSRVFEFEAGGRSRFYLGSADLMPRNLDNRLEVVVPVIDQRSQQRLGSALNALLDDAAAWKLRADGSWQRLRPKKGEPWQAAQAALMRNARRRRREPAKSVR
jgi:polyphosphate kinase